MIITRHFPPAVSGGARRPYGLFLALTALGHSVNVVAPELPDGVPGLSIFHANSSPDFDEAPARTTPIRDFAREALLLPDPDIRWARRVAKAVKISGLARPDWIITTSPPESIHVAGEILKTHYGCQWLADFRDFWLKNPLRKDRLKTVRRLRETAIANRLMKSVNAVAATDEHIAAEIASYTADNMPFAVIPNFAIPLTLMPEGDAALLPHDKNNIVYTGSFSLSDPGRKFEEALEQYCALAKDNDRLHIAGRLTSQELDTLSKFQTTSDIEYHGVLSLPDALAMQAQADILMLFTSEGAMSPSGKFYEYCALDKPILLVCPRDWHAVIDEMENPPHIIKDTTVIRPVRNEAAHSQSDQLFYAYQFLELMALSTR
ncbi:glycosyltransferase [Robiginitomaculum antarcticum]|uniref:glycosyltransferase n=1 Tax=Robiginitomaculum antarcticum TaxID=437507 RepID=UPI00039F30A6|nr:glycosyltransferase [Robiginitomaculum antarcticum]